MDQIKTEEGFTEEEIRENVGEPDSYQFQGIGYFIHQGLVYDASRSLKYQIEKIFKDKVSQEELLKNPKLTLVYIGRSVDLCNYIISNSNSDPFEKLHTRAQTLENCSVCMNKIYSIFKNIIAMEESYKATFEEFLAHYAEVYKNLEIMQANLNNDIDDESSETLEKSFI